MPSSSGDAIFIADGGGTTNVASGSWIRGAKDASPPPRPGDSERVGETERVGVGVREIEREGERERGREWERGRE